MPFRIFLVGAVAALGIDLPTGSDLDAWARSGRVWWNARVAELEARHGNAPDDGEGTTSPAPAGLAEPDASDDDAAFATVVEEMVAAFAEEGVSEPVEPTDRNAQIVAGFGDATFGPDYAEALNRWADGLSEPAEPAPSAALVAGGDELDGVEPEAGLPSAVGASTPETEVDLDSEIPTSVSTADASAVGPQQDAGAGAEAVADEDGGGLSDAVELTGRAVQAWLTLLYPAGLATETPR